MRTRRETIRDLMSWWQTLPQARIHAARFPLAPDLDQELVATCRSR